jgi:hypothetical protein
MGWAPSGLRCGFAIVTLIFHCDLEVGISMGQGVVVVDVEDGGASEGQLCAMQVDNADRNCWDLKMLERAVSS